MVEERRVAFYGQRHQICMLSKRKGQQQSRRKRKRARTRISGDKSLSLEVDYVPKSLPQQGNLITWEDSL